ncbi:Retrovirus-related Pol polyprotein from transposon RE1, partial [Linum perenne]
MDLSTRRQLFKGQSRDGLYPIPLALFEDVQPQAHSVTLSTWHRRLGHANLDTVKHALRRSDLSFSNKRLPAICPDCCLGKMHKLPFPVSRFQATGPLDLICSDVWGPSPVASVSHQRYYILFYDHFSKYSWIYFVRYRSDLLQVFIQFRSLVEKYFGRPIRSFRADWGGEYQKLSAYLRDHGIMEQTSCPHTPEQNGCAERKHRHIVETGRTLIHQAKLPLQYWTYAFQAAVYIINRLPSSVLNNVSPYYCLFNADPDYTSLRVFGCLCFPWLKPYAAHKLDAKSAPCVFLGYSTRHKGYYCLNLHTQKVQVSRHVLFDETVLPYHVPTQYSQADSGDSTAVFIRPQLFGPPAESAPPTRSPAQLSQAQSAPLLQAQEPLLATGPPPSPPADSSTQLALVAVPNPAGP